MRKIKILALILALIAVIAVISACNSDDVESSGSDEATEGDKTESKGDGTEIGALDPEKLVLFADGVYKAYIIRSDLADSRDRTIYGDLRAAVKSRVGAMAKATTDFDKALADSPAILVGKTGFAESDAVYSTLKSGEAAARFVNGKYVIAYTSEQGAEVILEKVSALIKKADKKNIVIDSSWDIFVSYAETIGYTEEQLEGYISIPEYNGRLFDDFSIDMGQGSVMHIAEKTNVEEFEDYITELYGAGFEYYSSNEIANNRYYTFTSEAQIVSAMYLEAFKEARILVDNRATYGLLAAEPEAELEAVTEPSLTVLGIGATGWPGGMGYVYKLADGTFFIIDGGVNSSNSGSINSAMWLMATLEELADDPDNIVISGWLITHIHVDHLGAFIDMAKDSKYTDKVTVETVIYNQPSDSEMTKGGHTDRIPWMQRALDVWQPETLVKAHPGQVYYFHDLTITVLGTQDIVVPDSDSSHNNLSVVTMVNYKDLDALYLGDAEGLMNKALERLYGSELKADILQLAHHGYSNTDAGTVYKLADPTIVFWPVSTGHYDGTGGASVKTVSFNQMFFEPGITNHIAGETNMTIKDFATWKPEARWTPKIS